MERRIESGVKGPKKIPVPLQAPSQRAEMWELTEDNFWRTNAISCQERFAQASQRWNHNRSSAVNHIRNLEAEARELSNKEDILNREIMAIRRQKSLVNNTHNQEAQRLHDLDIQHSMEKQNLFENREKMEYTMNDWFKRQRIQDGVHERPWALPELIDRRPPERQLKLPPLANLHLPRETPRHDDRIVAIIDANGTILDKLQYLGLSNERTAAISGRAVLQPIKLRSAHRFYEDTRPSIYSFADGKGNGWIACMIQATGSAPYKMCQGCSNNQSPFDGCIAVGGHLFPKCGNCEWNGTSCQGLEPQSPNDMITSRPLLAPIRVRPQSLITGPGLESRAYEAHCGQPGLSLPGFKAVIQATMASASSCPNSRQMTPMTFRSMGFAAPDPCEITKESLILRHNGTFYTHPKCIEGVPLEKIDPSHPYWDPKWPDLRTLVEPILRSWEEKYVRVAKAVREGEPLGSTKYLYGRQVNRGKKILKFLEQGPISPYQLLSKRFMSVGKGSITSYDTLFRLCETIDTLANYKMDVEPVEWLRQRLHELIEVHGTSFNFSKTMHDFYNDSKLQALRNDLGFKNIGRPLGIKMPRKRAGSAGEGPRLALRPRKRKSLASHGSPSPPAEEFGDSPCGAGPSTDDGKKQKAAAEVLDSLETGEVSDADSWSGAPIAECDFRIYQIKTRLFTSSEKVTQYLAWVPENNVFEHQVLESTKPVVWGVQRESIDFSLRLEDVVKISWNLKALRVYLFMSDRHICFADDRPGGSVMVAFKRENTMRRFIKFCRREEIELVEETWKKMQHLWGTMQS